MNNEQKEYIVKLHNRMRNKLALGEIPKYNPAAKMPAFVRIQNPILQPNEMLILLFISFCSNGAMN